MPGPLAAARPLATAGLAALVLTGVGAAPALAAPTPAPSPGAGSLGDSLFATLGNGGYDALSYDFDLTFGAESTDPVSGTVTMVAQAKQALSSFSLDYAGTGSGKVLVNGQPAAVTSTGEKLVITPKRALPAKLPFVVSLTGYVTGAVPYDPDVAATTGFLAGASGTSTSPQPAYAHFHFPLNDHPSDKAIYTFRLTAPVGETAVASGVLLGKSTKRGKTTWTYLQRQPMATELIQLAVGDYKVVDRGTLSGVKVRDVVTPALASRVEPAFSKVGKHIAWTKARFGAYPFDVYGSLVIDDDIGFALETQTLSLYAPSWFVDSEDGSDVPQSTWEPTMVHELVHQWFGDSVSPTDWSDIWLNESHATFYELLYAEEQGLFAEAWDGIAADVEGLAEFFYNRGDIYRARYGPVGKPADSSDAAIFSNQTYYGGFLVLYALRQEIGAAALAKLDRTWVTRYKGQSRGTADYIKLASEIAGRDLGPFLRSWLYDTTTPPMPGHPDWVVNPVPPATLAKGVAAPESLPLPHRH